MEKNKNIKLAGWTLAVFALHMLVAMQLRTATMWGDEVGVQAIVAFFAGEDWSGIMSALVQAYYGFGGALPYVPIYWLVKDPDIRYVCMGILDSAMLAMIVVMVYAILGSLHTISAKKRRRYAAVIAIFPSFMVYTKWCWGEVMLAVIPWVLLLLVARMVEGKGNRAIQSALLGLLLIYAYSINGRGLIYTVCIAMILVYVRMAYKRWYANVPVLAISYGVCYAGYKAIKSIVVKGVWATSDEGKLANTMGKALNLLSRAASRRRSTNIFQMAASHIATSSIASYGLVLLVFIFLAFYIWKKAKRQPVLPADVAPQDVMQWETVGLFCVLAFLGSFATTIIGFYGAQNDYLIYNRYYAPSLGLIALLALLIVNEIGFPKKGYVLTAVLFALVPLLYLTVWQNLAFGRQSVYFNIYPYLIGDELTALFGAGGITLGLFVIFALLSCSRFKKWNIVFLAVVFLHAYAYCAIQYILPSGLSEAAHLEGTRQVMAEPMHALPGMQFYTLNAGGQAGKLQYRLPQVTIHPLDDIDAKDVKEKIPENSVVLSMSDMELDALYEDFYKVKDSRLGLHENLWIYGEELAQTFKDEFGFSLTNRINDPILVFKSELGGEEDVQALPEGRILLEERDFTLHLKEGNAVLIAEFPLRIREHTVYRIDLELDPTVTPAARGSMVVDLAAPGYDNAQQEANAFFSETANKYAIYFDSGDTPAQPMDVALRVICYALDKQVSIQRLCATEMSDEIPEEDMVTVARQELRDAVDLPALTEEEVLLEKDAFVLQHDEANQVQSVAFGLAVEPNTIYRIDLELAKDMPVAAREAFMVDFATEGYDNAQQEVSAFVTPEENYYDIYLDSGTLPRQPLDVALRFVCYNLEETVEVQHIVVTKMK